MSHPSETVPFYDEASVAGVLRLESLIPAMETALRDFSSGAVQQPVRTIVPVAQQPGALMGYMPAICREVMERNW